MKKRNPVIIVLVLIVFLVALYLSFRTKPVKRPSVPILPAKEMPAAVRYGKFEKFWHKMYSEVSKGNTEYILKPLYNDKKRRIETYDLTLTSYDGLKLKGYFSVPYGVKNGRYPGVLLLHGYGSYGTSNWAHFFAERGYAALSIDLRGHGRSKSVYNPGFPGLMTDGILHVTTFSMVKIIMDSLASLKFLEHYKNINPHFIFVTGGSMGGGLSLIDAAIDPNVTAAAADVPFLAAIPLQMPEAKMGPYMEVKAFLKKHPGDGNAVAKSLYYVDAMNFASWIKVPVMIGIGLKDEDCPPVGSFAVYKAINSKKKLFIAKNSGHVVLPGWNLEVFKFFAPYLPGYIKHFGSRKINTKEKRKIL